MEAELTRHFMNNVSEEPDTSGSVPLPYSSALPSYHAHTSNSAPASHSSKYTAPAAAQPTIPGVLNSQEESVHVSSHSFQMLWKIVLIFFSDGIAQAVTRSVKADTELLGLKKRVRFGD